MKETNVYIDAKPKGREEMLTLSVMASAKCHWYLYVVSSFTPHVKGTRVLLKLSVGAVKDRKIRTRSREENVNVHVVVY